jgi:hypothetical protein
MAAAPGLVGHVAPLHRALTRELSRLHEAVPLVSPGDEAAAGHLGSWAFDVVDALHHYLRALESWIRPVIDAREGHEQFSGDVLRAVARDQAFLEATAQRALAAALRWQDGASAADRDTLAVHLSRLRSGTALAFARIEGDLAPLADRLVDDDRLAAVPRHPPAALGGRRGRALVGAMLVGDGALAGAPTGPLARVRRAAARREYRRRTAALAGRLP